MGSLWEDIRKTVKDGITIVADRTDEYAKIGRIKVDIAGINHNISKLFSELGGRVYHIYSTEKQPRVLKDTEVVDLLERIRAQEDKLRKNEAEIKRIKKEKEKERKKKEQKEAKVKAAKGKEEDKKKTEAKTESKSKPVSKTVKKPAATKKTTPKGTEVKGK